MGRTPASWDLHTMDGVGGPNQSIRTRTRAEKSTFILIASMPVPQYMFMGQYIRKQKDEHQNKEKSVALLMVLWLPKKLSHYPLPWPPKNEQDPFLKEIIWPTRPPSRWHNSWIP